MSLEEFIEENYDLAAHNHSGLFGLMIEAYEYAEKNGVSLEQAMVDADAHISMEREGNEKRKALLEKKAQEEKDARSKKESGGWDDCEC